MPFIKKTEARAAARRVPSLVFKSADKILRESAADHSSLKTYDIFLSHSHEDAELILGVKQILEEKGRSVYVDWIEDAQLSRASVNADTAAVLRVRMQSCTSMLFATSQSSPTSRWMPWELGYFDGLRKGQIGILPLVDDANSTFKGQEYLGLYPVVEDLPTTSGSRNLFVTTGKKYLALEDFAKGKSEYREFR